MSHQVFPKLQRMSEVVLRWHLYWRQVPQPPPLRELQAQLPPELPDRQKHRDRQQPRQLHRDRLRHLIPAEELAEVTLTAHPTLFVITAFVAILCVPEVQIVYAERQARRRPPPLPHFLSQELIGRRLQALASE